MARILFVHPLFLSRSAAEQASASPYFPLGLLSLAAYVRDAGHHVAVFDGTFAEDERSFARALAEERPDIVGISVVAPNRATALELAAMAAATDAVVVLGGPDPTASPQSYLGHVAVDVVVHHEGEQTITRLAELVDAGRLDVAVLADEPGVAFRRDGQAVVNQSRPPIENLDELPFPARDLIDMERYLAAWEETSGYSSLTISTARGCPFNCEWCRDSVHGAGFRQRSAQHVADEVAMLADTYEIARLRVVDDVDGIDRAWFEAWAAAVQAHDAVIPFEALHDVARQDLPLLDVRDSL